MPIKRLRALWLAALSVTTLVACLRVPEPLPVPNEAFGLAPVYIDSFNAYVVRSEPPREIVDGRGFALLDDILYIVDYLSGIHVVDNRQPDLPVFIGFISVPGVVTVTGVDTLLYVNNYQDLVTLSVAEPAVARVIDRDRELYPSPPEFPEGHIGYFECYDPSRGLIAGWVERMLVRPECLSNRL